MFRRSTIAMAVAVGTMSFVAAAPLSNASVSASAAHATRCSGADPESIMIVKQQDNGQNIRVNCNETIEIRFSENLDGGPNSARWHAGPVNQHMLQKSPGHFKSCGKRPGCSGTYVQDFFVKATGMSPIQLALRVPGQAKAEKKFAIEVHTLPTG